jgi:hypothetical protein
MCHAIFSESLNKVKAPVIASYEITEILAKKKKELFEDGDMIKERFVVTGNSIFNEIKNKT